MQKKHYKVLARNDDASAFTTDKGKTNSKEKRSQLTKEKEFNKLASSKLRQSETMTDRLTHSLTRVKCSATSVAKELRKYCRFVHMIVKLGSILL